MGLFDIFKKKNIKEEPEIEAEKIEFSEIDSWIKKQTKKANTNEEKSIQEIKQIINQYIKELKERIQVLQEFNVDEKSAQDNFKTISKSGREKYIEMLENMFDRFENINQDNLKDYIDRVNTIFLDFEKNSRKNYERATILIGKEMVAIKDTMKSFSKELLDVFQEKREIITTILNIDKIKETLDKSKLNEKDLEETIKEISGLEKTLDNKEKKNIELEKELKELKKSKEYLENLSNKRHLESSKEDLSRNIMRLKQMIDFKALASFFHVNPKQMEVVKECREDFQSCFMKDSGNSIIFLLEESKKNNRQIQEKTYEIKKQIEDLEKLKSNIQEDPTISLENQIKNTEEEIQEIQKEIEKAQEREIQHEEEKQKILDTLKSKLSRMDVEIID
jgi:hypothetical protein